ncbi:MAG TPA: D-2-hydroxyacid dehydrogenase [Tepidisphaeraceae bacterium]|jgi:phosphoglycerate dehydrogenase-like enzyme|nr:D-2-hydroxyacid dehydrogenase [Tepidisphaeraceae bacterium]
MNSAPLTIWCNAHLGESATAELRRRVAGHRLVFPSGLQTSNLAVGAADPLLNDADVALGQPDPVQVMQIPRLKWVHLTTAGYTRYDRDDVREAFRARGALMTNSSMVYAEPCAEHVFAMMLAMARRLPQSRADQLGPRSWLTSERRIQSRLLVGQSVLILGFGAIAARLVELLAPFKMNITAVRRKATGDEGCRVITSAQTDEALSLADHVVNVLPANASTENFLDARRLSLMKPTALLYNIGRGTTIDQSALLSALQNERIAGAYLDVTDPEPLPPGHALWSAPNCFITPHTAGGHSDEFDRLVRHFADNFDRFIAGRDLNDRII